MPSGLLSSDDDATEWPLETQLSGEEIIIPPCSEETLKTLVET